MFNKILVASALALFSLAASAQAEVRCIRVLPNGMREIVPCARPVYLPRPIFGAGVVVGTPVVGVPVPYSATTRPAYVEERESITSVETIPARERRQGTCDPDFRYVPGMGCVGATVTDRSKLSGWDEPNAHCKPGETRTIPAPGDMENGRRVTWTVKQHCQ